MQNNRRRYPRKPFQPEDWAISRNCILRTACLFEETPSPNHYAIFDPGMPDIKKPFDLYTDASNVASGFVLAQNGRPIQFAGKTFSKTEMGYSVGEKEMLAVITALKKFFPYLKGSKFTVWTDHKPLIGYLSRRGLELSGREARWLEKLLKFDLNFKYLEGKKNVVADFLSRPVLNILVSVDQLSLDSFGKIQRDCPELSRYFLYFEKGCSKEKPFDLSNISLFNGLLYHLWSPYSGAKYADTITQVVVPIVFRKKLMKQSHNLGHYAAAATYDVLRKNWWWPNMFADIKKFCDECKTCEHTKKPIGKVPMEKDWPKFFNQRVAIDPCGPFPVTKRGNKYLIVAVECFSKWPCAYPTSSLSSEEIYNGFVENYVYIFGPPQELLSDRGANMISGFAKGLCRDFGIRKMNTTSEHPQADPAERYVKTIKEIIKKLVIDFKGDWDLHVGKALSAMRWHKSRATQFSPFQVVFGRDVFLPHHLEFGYFDFENPSLRSEQELKISGLVKERLEAKSEEYKSSYDARITEKLVDIMAGDVVMVQTIRKKGPLDPQMLGPFRVKRWVTRSTVLITELDGSKPLIHNVVNVNRVRKTAAWNDKPTTVKKIEIPTKSCRPAHYLSPAPIDAVLVNNAPVLVNNAPVAPVLVDDAPVVDIPQLVNDDNPGGEASAEESVEYVVEEIAHHQVRKDGYTYFSTFFQGFKFAEWVRATSFVSDDGVINETFQTYLEAEGLNLAQLLSEGKSVGS